MLGAHAIPFCPMDMRTGWTVRLVCYTYRSLVHCGMYCVVYTILSCRTTQAEAQSRTVWNLLELLWTFVGNPGHILERFWVAGF